MDGCRAVEGWVFSLRLPMATQIGTPRNSQATQCLNIASHPRMDTSLAPFPLPSLHTHVALAVLHPT